MRDVLEEEEEEEEEEDVLVVLCGVCYGPLRS